MDNIPAISLRLDMIDGTFDLDSETTAYMATTRKAIAELAKSLAASAPSTCDVGRLIAAIDHLQQAKNILCDSAILGCEAETRKRKRVNDNTAESK